MNKRIDVLTDKIAYLSDRLDMAEVMGDTHKADEVQERIYQVVEELREEQKMQKIESRHREQFHREMEEKRKSFLD